MSRFFRNVSDSESDSDSSSSDSYFSESDATHSSEDESEDERVSTPTAKGGSNWFMKGASDSDSEDEVKRVVKSAKDKRIEELETSYKAIENALKINDWAAVSNEYEKMLKVISKINANSEKIPNSYIQILITIEDGFGDIKDKKKLNSANAKALNVLKQKVKKNNKLYEKRIEALRNGQEEEEEEETPVELPTKTKAKTVHIVDEDDVDDGFTTVGKSGKTIEVSSETLPKKLREVIQARGKKNTDKNEQIQILGKLLAVANTPYFQIKVLFALISARFDYSSGLATHMTTEMWRSTSQSIHTLFNILEINPEISIDESYEEIDDVDGEPDANVDYNKIQGSIVSFIEQLDDEFTKSLQNLDPHATEYIERLADETPLVTIIIRAQRYFESKKQIYNTTRTVIRRIEHTYYKPDHVITTVEKLVYENLSKQSETKIVAPESTPEELVRDLCVFLYKNAEPLLRTRAMLCHIYSVALHGHYYDARDMLLMSHLQETIHQADVTTQVLFNRTMVQIGLSAFKEGLIRESLSCLQELHNTGRVKELLAQGTSNIRHGQNPDQDKLDRQRQIPFHMHINCELVECVFLTCSMLLEVPAMAAAGTNPEAKKRIISKPFRRLLDYSDRQIFHGPPENTRDHIMAASHALAAGEWERSRDFMWDIKIWNLLPEPEKIKAMLASKIQEEALRTYLFTYAPYYSTISMSQLGQMFDLPSTRVYSLISKLIWSEELNAGLDQVRNMVVLHAKDPSTIQRLALNLADKTSSLVEGNEKIFELKVSDPSAHLSWSKNTRRTQPNRAKN